MAIQRYNLGHFEAYFEYTFLAFAIFSDNYLSYCIIGMNHISFYCHDINFLSEQLGWLAGFILLLNDANW